MHGGRSHALFVLVRKRLKKREESGLKNFCTPIFFKVVQVNPIKYLLLTFLRDLAMDPTQICTGGGVTPFLFWSGKDSKTGRKRRKKLLHSHFLQSSAR